MGDDIGTFEVVLGYVQIIEWSPKRGERLPHTSCIVRRGLNQDVNIDGRTRISVYGECVCPNHQESCVLLHQGGKDVAVVLVHRGACYCSASVVTLTGMVARVYEGIGRFVNAHIRRLRSARTARRRAAEPATRASAASSLSRGTTRAVMSDLSRAAMT